MSGQVDTNWSIIWIIGHHFQSIKTFTSLQHFKIYFKGLWTTKLSTGTKAASSPIIKGQSLNFSTSKRIRKKSSTLPRNHVTRYKVFKNVCLCLGFFWCFFLLFRESSTQWVWHWVSGKQRLQILGFAPHIRCWKIKAISRPTHNVCHSIIDMTLKTVLICTLLMTLWCTQKDEYTVFKN
jgi:hypothetical protein